MDSCLERGTCASYFRQNRTLGRWNTRVHNLLCHTHFCICISCSIQEWALACTGFANTTDQKIIHSIVLSVVVQSKCADECVEPFVLESFLSHVQSSTRHFRLLIGLLILLVHLNNDNNYQFVLLEPMHTAHSLLWYSCSTKIMPAQHTITTQI
jgi:hypothetical protein